MTPQNTKLKRQKIILDYLMDKKLSAPEINQGLYDTYKIDVTAKTSRRDLDELLTSQKIVEVQCRPKKYVVKKEKFLSIKLKDEEVDLLKKTLSEIPIEKCVTLENLLFRT